MLSRLLGIGAQVGVSLRARGAGDRVATRRAALERKLLRLAQRTLGYAEGALPAVAWAPPWAVSRQRNQELLLRVVDQTQRRVRRRDGTEKVLSLFEPHTDIIWAVAARTSVTSNFATRSGLARHGGGEGHRPTARAACRCLSGISNTTARRRRAAFGGYASRENLKQAKALGVTHAMFHKKRGMKETDMSPSPWVYRQLKRFRAGIAGISYETRFGLGLCRWRGWPRFQAYVHSAVFAHNLMRLVRPPPRPA